MTREMWMLDQLACEDMPMPLMVEGFGSAEPAQRAVLSFLAEGVVEVLAADGTALPAWRVAELCRLAAIEWTAAISQLRMRITDLGLKKYPGLG